MFTCVPGDAANRALAPTRFGDVRWVGETGSTNSDLMALARNGAPEGTVLVADHQTAGRGRADRVWTAPPRSSLLVSVLLRPSPSAAGFSGMALGIAAADAIRETTAVAVRLKWPNDVVWPGRGDSSDRKLGGILAEADWSDSAAPAVVVGLGLNVNWPAGFPDELASLAVSLNHVAGREIDREQLLVAILQHLEQWCDRDRAVVAGVRERSATLGNRVRVELASERIEGDAVDITDDGHLLVRLDDGSNRTITAGDVIHVRPA